MPNTYKSFIGGILIAIVFFSSGYFVATQLESKNKVQVVSVSTQTQKETTAVVPSPSTEMINACKYISTTSEKPFMSYLQEARYYFPYAGGHQTGKINDLPGYAVFIDCFSSSKEYNYGVFDKARNKYYYIGYIQGDMKADDEDWMLAYGGIALAAIQKADTANKRLAFIISGGDAEKNTQAEVDLVNIEQKDNMLIAKKTKFLGKSGQKEPKTGDIIDYISLYPGDYPANF